MFSLKRLFIILAAAVILIPTVSAQGRQRNQEMSVEQSYLQESIEIMIIRETARAYSREQKQIALDYIGDAIDRGNKNDEIRETLEFLSKEGVMIQAKENGRTMNNYPEIRRQAAKYLGQIGTESARKNLIDMMTSEKEPMVLQEVIKSLGDIGTNDNNETVHFIAGVINQWNNHKPDNIMAVAAIDAFEKIARKNNGLNHPETIRALNQISAGLYVQPVKERARQLLAELRSYGN